MLIRNDGGQGDKDLQRVIEEESEAIEAEQEQFDMEDFMTLDEVGEVEDLADTARDDEIQEAMSEEKKAEPQKKKDETMAVDKDKRMDASTPELKEDKVKEINVVKPTVKDACPEPIKQEVKGEDEFVMEEGIPYGEVSPAMQKRDSLLFNLS